jgi:putative colanic acid biosynthesis glycosyltransferase
MKILSIVTICYNNAAGLNRTIATVDEFFSKYESLVDIEHIIIDGGSTDGSVEDIKNCISRRSVKSIYISEIDSGIYDAMNKGVLNSSGRYVVFLNAGDEINSGLDVNILMLKLGSFCDENYAGIAFSSIIKFKRASFKLKSRSVQISSPRMPAVHQSIFFKKLILEKYSFDTSYRICGDYDNFSRIFSAGFDFNVEEDAFSIFYADGISSRSPFKLFMESSYVTEKYYKISDLRRFLIMARLLLSLTKFQLLRFIYG